MSTTKSQSETGMINDNEPETTEGLNEEGTNEFNEVNEVDKVDEVKVLHGDDVFVRTIIEKTVHLPIMMIGKNVRRNIKSVLERKCEGVCIEQGYVKQNSINIVAFSCGETIGEYVTFQVTFECMICYPVEGMFISCYTKEITKAGIRAEIYEHRTLERSTPLMIYVARDHHYNTTDINNVSKNEQIIARILGVRFELNDPFVSVIAEYIKTKTEA